MSGIIKGFHGRRTGSRISLPPGQHLTADFPVLQAGPTPHIDLARHRPRKWRFTIRTESGTEQSWTWAQLHLVPKERVDIHCVTSQSKLGTRWDGVSLYTSPRGDPWREQRYAGIDAALAYPDFGAVTRSLDQLPWPGCLQRRRDIRR